MNPPKLAFFALLLLAGCKEPKTAAQTTAPPALAARASQPAKVYTMKGLAGIWQGDVVFSDTFPMNEREQIRQKMRSNITTLRPDGTFKWTDNRQIIEGIWRIDGNSVILDRKKINGVTVDQYINQLVKEHARPETLKALRHTMGRLQISWDGKNLLSPTLNNQLIMMLVKK